MGGWRVLGGDTYSLTKGIWVGVEGGRELTQWFVVAFRIGLSTGIVLFRNLSYLSVSHGRIGCKG